MRGDSPFDFAPMCVETDQIKDRRCSMKAQQISRRTWLAQVAVGGVAIWNELNFGFGRRGWSIALGGDDLATGPAHAQDKSPAKALQVNLGFVNAYVLVRGR